ncbi:hypothetical protein [Gulosibacter molinativorax]|uniref:hypothetical protein n=1 Tax=Gulosibacter molinativorax TaxID=256821 RepID=UPI000428B06F|nr:hypothetical protein [Gulosibacter molinativorax]QUY63319.1 Hypotetical protein [Gulosibacter molinativorax]
MAKRRDGTWASDVDRLALYMQHNPMVTWMAARVMFPAIPVEVVRHIFDERKRKKNR